MPDVFLSYKREDLTTATRLVHALRTQGLEVWWDRDIPAGAPWETTIEKALSTAAVVLVCWSKAAIASDNVRSEARWAREQGRLIQLFVEPCSPPLFFGEHQGIDLSDWKGDPLDPRFRQLVSGVRTVVGDAVTGAGALPADTTRRSRRQGRVGARSALWLSVAAIAILAGTLVTWFALHRVPAPETHESAAGPQQPERFAVSRFDVLDSADADLGKFAGGLQAEMVDQLNQSHIHVTVPDPAAKDAGGPGAAFAFGGAVERDGDQILARMQLNDAREHVTVWSDAYRGAAKSAGVLQNEIAAEAAQVADTATRVDPASKGDTEMLGLGIKSSLYAYRDADEDRESEWENAKLLLAQAPQLSHRHSNFAVVSVFLAAISTPERAAELRALAAQEASNALRLNPRDFLAFSRDNS